MRKEIREVKRKLEEELAPREALYLRQQQRTKRRPPDGLARRADGRSAGRAP
jgi:hypothetical protein